MDTLSANQVVHGYLAATGEYNKSPHFLLENKLRVGSNIQTFLQHFTGSSLFNNTKILDVGCGTGFLSSVFSGLGTHTLTGVDITQEMLDVAIADYPTNKFLIAKAEELPFVTGSFDLVSNYSFLDHVENLSIVFEESFRVLAKGGLFYSGLNPNAMYSKLVKNAYESSEDCLFGDNSEYLKREYQSIFDNGNVYSEQYGISNDALMSCEPQKTLNHGLDPKTIVNALKSVGFQQVKLLPNWFFGQRQFVNTDFPVEQLNHYLVHSGWPTLGLFKYFDFMAHK